MKWEELLASLFVMDEETWERHAHPGSVWSRFTVLPLLILSVWSRVWLGWWCLLPIIMSTIWTWWNPRAFPKPENTENWASQAVLGERLWLARRHRPIPKEHRLMPHLLALVSFCGVPFIIWGLAFLKIWPIFFGCALVYLGKLWFIDRMVWLYRDMRRQQGGNPFKAKYNW